MTHTDLVSAFRQEARELLENSNRFCSTSPNGPPIKS